MFFFFLRLSFLQTNAEARDSPKNACGGEYVFQHVSSKITELNDLGVVNRSPHSLLFQTLFDAATPT